MKLIDFKTLLCVFCMFFLAANVHAQAPSEEVLPKIFRIEVRDASIVNIEPATSKQTISYTGSSKPYKVRDNSLIIEGNAISTVIVSGVTLQIVVSDNSVVNLNPGVVKNLEIITEDASVFSTRGDYDNILATSHDASVINLEGTAKSVNITSNDASVTNAGKLISDIATAKSYDTSTIIVNSKKDLTTQINDNSNIEAIKGVYEEQSSDSSDSDGSISVEIENEKFQKKKMTWRPNQRVWAGIELGLTGFSQEPFSFKVATADSLWRNDQPSFSLHLNIFEEKFKLGTEYLKFVTGLGIQFDFMKLNEDVSLSNTQSGVQIFRNNEITEYKKNTLILSQVQAPLLLNINTSPGSRKNFHIDGGLLVGFRFKQVLKQEWEESYKTEIERKTTSKFHQNPLNLSATVRVGFAGWSVFGIYGLNPLYKTNEGPGFNVWNIGVTVIPF